MKLVEKDLNRIAKNELKKIIARITALADNPGPPGCEKLTGLERYRIRQGRYRILYSMYSITSGKIDQGRTH